MTCMSLPYLKKEKHADRSPQHCPRRAFEQVTDRRKAKGKRYLVLC